MNQYETRIRMRKGLTGGGGPRSLNLDHRRSYSRNRTESWAQRVIAGSFYAKLEPCMQDQEEQLRDVIPVEEKKEISIDDEENPRSLVNLAKKVPCVSAAIERIKEQNYEYLTWTESDFMKGKQKKFSVLEQRIRFGLWAEYDACKRSENGRLMQPAQILAGLCTRPMFERLMRDNLIAAFILCPPANYNVVVKEALNRGLERIREIVDAPVLDNEGYLIPRAADAVIKAVQMLDTRVKGAVIQKVDQRSINYNMNKEMDARLPVQGQLPQSMEDLDKLLLEAQTKLKQINSAPVKETILIEAKKDDGSGV